MVNFTIKIKKIYHKTEFKFLFYLFSITGKCSTYQIDANSDSELLWYKYFKVNHTRSTVNDMNTIHTNLIYRLTSEDVDRKYDVIQINDVSKEFYKVYKFKFETDSPFLGNFFSFFIHRILRPRF